MIAVDAALERLGARNPYAVDLATLASLAVQVEPELLRDLRMLIPDADPGTESDLWLSDLVDSKGKTVAGAPLSDAQALPLSGAVGPGEYAIISGIPLSQMAKPLPPGEYTLKMRILDTISKQSYNLEQKFKITA